MLYFISSTNILYNMKERIKDIRSDEVYNIINKSNAFSTFYKNINAFNAFESSSSHTSLIEIHYISVFQS